VAWVGDIITYIPTGEGWLYLASVLDLGSRRWLGYSMAGHKMRQSVGRTGVCWDNAVAESASSSLKRELVHRYRFATRAEARRAIFAWINRYNSRRRHSTLGYTAPIAWERNCNPTKATPAA
jgi:putative transposase